MTDHRLRRRHRRPRRPRHLHRQAIGGARRPRTPRPASCVIDEDQARRQALDADPDGGPQLLRRRHRARLRPARRGAQVGRQAALDRQPPQGARPSSESLTDQLDAARTTRLEASEKRLKAQFAAMEPALQASQTQQAWLTGQLASLARLAAFASTLASGPMTGQHPSHPLVREVCVVHVHPRPAPPPTSSPSVMTASPGQLVVMLYDGARRFLYQAAAALREDDVAQAARAPAPRGGDHRRAARDARPREGRRDRRRPPGPLRLLPAPQLSRPASSATPTRSTGSTSQLGELRESWAQIAGAAMIDPYERLARARRARARAASGAGALEDLPALAGERAALVAALPARRRGGAPGAGAPRAPAGAHHRVELAAARRHTRRELRPLRRGRGAVARLRRRAVRAARAGASTAAGANRPQVRRRRPADVARVPHGRERRTRVHGRTTFNRKEIRPCSSTPPRSRSSAPSQGASAAQRGARRQPGQRRTPRATGASTSTSTGRCRARWARTSRPPLEQRRLRRRRPTATGADARRRLHRRRRRRVGQARRQRARAPGRRQVARARIQILRSAMGGR